MITPSFGLTATERVLPKLALDFTTASLDSRITFTRTTGASNPATYVNSSGYVTAATDNQPRFDYDPVTLACKGLLIEESRQNTLRYSQDISNASGWGVFSGAAFGSTTESAPDNTNSGVVVVKTTASSGIYTNYSITGVIGTTYTLSCFVKAGTSNFARLALHSNNSSGNVGSYLINLTTGELTTITAGVGATATNFGNGWWRLTVTGTATATALRMYLYPGTTTETNTSAVFWGAQLEVGAFPTSYIPTTSAALTRNADVATMTGTNFSDWFNANEGTFFAKADTYYPAATAGVVLIASDGTANERIQVAFGSSSLSVAVTDGGASQVSGLTASAASANTFYDMMVGYKLNDCGFAVNAGTPTTDTTCTMPTVDQLWIGRRTTYLNGHVAKIMYWPQKLITAEIKAFSK